MLRTSGRASGSANTLDGLLQFARRHVNRRPNRGTWGPWAHDPQTAPETGRSQRAHPIGTRRPQPPTARRLSPTKPRRNPKNRAPQYPKTADKRLVRRIRENAGNNHRRSRNRTVPPKPPGTTIPPQHQSAAARHGPRRLRNRPLPPKSDICSFLNGLDQRQGIELGLWTWDTRQPITYTVTQKQIKRLETAIFEARWSSPTANHDPSTGSWTHYWITPSPLDVQKNHHRCFVGLDTHANLGRHPRLPPRRRNTQNPTTRRHRRNRHPRPKQPG